MVQCHYCSAILARWKVEDSPWEEHAKWYPNCEYLQLVKGKIFIKEVQKKWRNQDVCKEEQTEDEISWPFSVTIGETSSVNSRDSMEAQFESTRMKEDQLCRICFIYKADVAYIPCGHLMTCGRCVANSLATSRLCPVCRSDIQSCIKLLFTSS